MVNSPTHGCLEPEVLAAYADQGLSLAERAGVETHLASCPRCTAQLAGVVRMVAELAPATHEHATGDATPLVTPRAVIGALATAAAVIAALAVPPILGPRLDRDTGLVSLAGSVGEHRSVLGRLSGGFPHAPLPAQSAGGQDTQGTAGTDRVLLTSGEIRGSFGEFAAPSRLHALGVANLLSRRYDDAAQLLLAASREQPTNARYLNDVATVQLERARLGLRPDDLPRALAAAERATRLDPSLREAWFNRALAISALSLTEQARAAWTEYLKRDSSSPWAGEARQRLEELTKPTAAAAWETIAARLDQSIDAATADAAVRAQTTEARNFIENELFVEWANAVLAGGDGGAELERLRVMADAMTRIAGDTLYSDAVDAVGRAASNNTKAALAQSHKTFAVGSSLFNQDRFGDAAQPLVNSRDQLRALGSPFASLADVQLAALKYIGGNYAQADDELRVAHDRVASRSYRYVLARATWFRGLIAFARGDLAAAQSFYNDTLSTFERMGDVEQTAAAHGLLSGLHDVLGDKTLEWQHRRLALVGSEESRSARFRYSLLVSAAISIGRQNPEAALVLFDGAIAAARESGREAALMDAMAQRAAALAAIGAWNEAHAAVDDARQRLAAISDESFRRVLELPVLAVESDLLRRSDSRAAVAAADRAIQTATARGDRTRLPQLLLRRAKANIAWGKLDEAEKALLNGIQVFDETRANPAGITGITGIAAFDESWQLYEAAIQLAIHRGDHERAFAMAERGRAHLPTRAQQHLQVPSLAEMQQRLRSDEAVVVLNQFDDELAVWVIRNQGTRVVMQPLRRTDASRIVARYQDEIQMRTAPEASAALYDVLVRPVDAQLAGATHLSFVPDGMYQGVSFAGLWNRSRSKFLVEQLTLAASPSAAALHSARSGVATVDKPGDTLVFAADADPAAIKTIADQYPTAEVVLGPQATRSRLLAGSASVIHVVAPTFGNERYPSLSRLMLNDEPGRRFSGALTSDEIASRPMLATRLVVLDEIRSRQSYRTAGTFDLATAFLAAGVPAVLGTLPGADENATRELMLGFHREMARKASPAEALARVQRNAVKQNGGRLGAWTALEIYGSDR